MDYGQVFKRSWHMVRHYRALWIFGIVLGLVTFSWNATVLGILDDDDLASPSGVIITPLPGETFYDALERTIQGELAEDRAELVTALRDPDRFFSLELGRRVSGDVLAVLAVLAAAFVVTLLVCKVARYVSETALIRMVGDYEDRGERLEVRQGLRLGLSRAAWRLFFIDLVIDVPVILAFVVLFTVAFAPVILGILGSTASTVIAGSLLTGGLFAGGILLAIVAGALLSVLKRFFRQACALESLGVVASIRRGWTLVRHRPADVLVMWLIMVGIGLGWAVAVMASLVVLFPLLLLFIILGGVAGALPAYLVYLLASLLFEGAVPVTLAVVVGLPIFFVVMLAPWWCAGGLMQVFESSVWTLTYRQLCAAGAAEPARMRALEAKGAGLVPAAQAEAR